MRFLLFFLEDPLKLVQIGLGASVNCHLSPHMLYGALVSDLAGLAQGHSETLSWLYTLEWLMCSKR